MAGTARSYFSPIRGGKGIRITAKEGAAGLTTDGNRGKKSAKRLINSATKEKTVAAKELWTGGGQGERAAI